MRIFLIAVGERMPQWVKDGYVEYAKRLPRECCLKLVEIPSPKRSKSASVARLMDDEADSILAAVPRGAQIVALDERGQSWDTKNLARRLEGWIQSGRDVALLVGGADGLAPKCKDKAEQLWSLSPLTLPHPLVRVLVAEQIYRAWTILTNHPYHRN